MNSSEKQLIVEEVKKVRFVINKERMSALKIKIPIEILDMATIQNRVDLRVKR